MMGDYLYQLLCPELKKHPQAVNLGNSWGACRGRADRHDPTGGWQGRAELRPSLGERAALLEQVAAAIGGFDLVADGVSERHLGDLGRETRTLGRPVAEGASEAMHRELALAHASQRHRHRHVAERLVGLAAGEDEA